MEFSPGQAWADIEIKPFLDGVEFEGDEEVVLDIDTSLLDGMAGVLLQAAVLIQKPGNGANNSPVVPGIQTFEVGYGAVATTEIGQIFANDPDGDPITFMPTNPHRYFKLSADGKLSVSSQLHLPEQLEPTYLLPVTVADNRGGRAYATIVINTVPLVTISGDYQAVEPTGPGLPPSDPAKVFFHRTGPLNAPLTIDYQFAWAAGPGLASPADFANLPPLDNKGYGQITFPATSAYVELQLSPAFDGPEPLASESVVLRVVARQGYATLSEAARDIPWPNDSSEVWRCRQSQSVQIYDGITLCGDRPADGGNPDPHPVHISDVLQGGCQLNCWFWGVVVSILNKPGESALIQGMIVDNGDGTATVTFPGSAGTPLSQHTVAIQLANGDSAARLSNDTDAQGRTEAWMVVLERAYRAKLGQSFSRWYGRSDSLEQTTVGEVWRAFGFGTTSFFGPRKSSLQTLTSKLRTADIGGNRIVFSSRVAFDSSPNVKLMAGHAYTLLSIKNRGLPGEMCRIRDPHRIEPIEISMKELYDQIDGYFEQIPE